jgi:hypothetical protein
MPVMRQAQGFANWTGHPSLCDRLIASTLHTLAMLVSIVARLCASKQKNPTAECDGSPAQTLEANDVFDQHREATLLLLPTTATTAAAAAVRAAAATRKQRRNTATAQQCKSALATALMVSSDAWRSHASRPSNHEGGIRRSLNTSFSALCRESRFERRWNSRYSRRPTNQDSRDALRLPENDPRLGLWLNSTPA